MPEVMCVECGEPDGRFAITGCSCWAKKEMAEDKRLDRIAELESKLAEAKAKESHLLNLLNDQGRNLAAKNSEWHQSQKALAEANARIVLITDAIGRAMGEIPTGSDGHAILDAVLAESPSDFRAVPLSVLRQVESILRDIEPTTPSVSDHPISRSRRDRVRAALAVLREAIGK